jgi:hypothetical protein
VITTRFGTGDHRQHVAARAREIHERDALSRKTREELSEVSRAEIGPRNADLRLLALTAAVPDENEDDLVARARPRRELRERLLDVGLCRRTTIVRPIRYAVFAEPDGVGVRDPPALYGGISKLRCHFVEGRRVFLLAAQPADDHEMRLREKYTRRGAHDPKGEQGRREARRELPARGHYASPLALRYAHSAAINDSSRNSTTGMSHKSI